MDRKAWWATFHRVTKSWTQLNGLTMHAERMSRLLSRLCWIYETKYNVIYVNSISVFKNQHIILKTAAIQTTAGFETGWNLGSFAAGPATGPVSPQATKYKQTKGALKITACIQRWGKL